MDEPQEPREACCVEVHREGEWHIVGQYHSRKQAEIIADDYRSHGAVARVTTEGTVTTGD